MMEYVADLAALQALYPDAPAERSLTKVAPRLTPMYRKWIMASRFCVLTTVGPEGTDASPRGDDGPVVAEYDDRTLLLPDWRGNNRLDSLRNILRDPRVSLMFMVPGSTNVVRVNGTAKLTADPAITGRFEQAGKQPKTVIVVAIGEVYYQCAKAILRSGLWQRGDESKLVPTAGEMTREADSAFDAESYDAGYEDYARPRMW